MGSRRLFLLLFVPDRDYISTMAMHKQMVSLSRPQIEYLKREAERLGISVSDLIRRIVDQHREGQ